MTAQPITDLPDPLMNIREVADLIGTSPGSIYSGRRAGTGVGALGFRIGRKLRFDPQDVAGFIEDQKAQDPKHVAVEA